MKLENRFDVPVSVDQAWPVLLDLERLAQCMPGATLDSVDGTEYQGRVKIKAGPVTVSYAGVLVMESVDESTHSVVLNAQAKEQRGSGTVKAVITAQVHPGNGTSRVDVTTDLAITGKPAQLGRGLIADVAGKIIDQFARNLAVEISAPELPDADVDPIDANNSFGSDAGASHANRSSSVRGTANLDLLSILTPHLVRGAVFLGLGVLGAMSLRRLLSTKRRGPSR